MNNAELKYSFDLGLKAIEPIRYALFDTFDISSLITNSQLDLIKRYCSIFDENEITKKLAGSLIRNSIKYPAARTSENFTNGQFVQLPTDVLVVLEEQAKLQITPATYVAINPDTDIAIIPEPALVTGPYIPVKPVTYDILVTANDNPFKNPYEKLVWRVDFSDRKHELISHGPLVFSHRMRYLCIPVDVNLDDMTKGLSVAEAFHNEVVDGAIKAAVEILKIKSAFTPQPQKASNNDNNN